jgi:hypothetical protein
MRVFLRVGARPIIRLATGAHRASDDAGREDIALLPERLDQIDAWIGEGLINGPELNAADFQIGVNVSALLCSEDLAPMIEGRPAAVLARRVVPDYGGRLGRVLPPEWLSGSPPSAAVSANETAAPAQAAPAHDIGAFLRRSGISEGQISELLNR